jgi:hypothetical protein
VTEPRLSALVYGPSGYGKSWLGSTVPAPRLIVDLEGRARYTPNGRGATEWDGVTDPMKLERSPTRTAIVTATDVGVLDTVYKWLNSGQHPFASVDVDSLMFAQMRKKNDIRPGAGHLTEANWGELLRAMEGLVQGFHDLTMKPHTKVRCVVFIAGSTLDGGFHVPMMQGQIASKIPFLVDLAGYLDNQRAESGELVRSLVVEPFPAQGIRDVKDGTHLIKARYGSAIRLRNENSEEGADFQTMFDALRTTATAA